VLAVDGDPVASTVADRLAQVVDNLLANALDAAPAGTTVRIEARTSPRGAELHVIDEGPGLSAELRERAFDRFWRGRPPRGTFGGSGIGLAIVRKLVELDGGTVSLEEAPGGGIDAAVVYPAG
jgi:signal transduction histidine kinase